jgi:hypothetical protein
MKRPLLICLVLCSLVPAGLAVDAQAQPAGGTTLAAAKDGEQRTTATGRAGSDLAGYRQQALADALREAVRLGAGIDLVSQTQAKDFRLDYDRIFTASFGYVRDYRIAGSRLGGDGIYEVTVEALVGKGSGDLKDELILRQLIARKGAPRVALAIDEKVEGVNGVELVRGWFEDASRQIQLPLVAVDALVGDDQALAERDKRLGDTNAAVVRTGSDRNRCDYRIEARLTGRYAGQESLYGSLPEHRFSLAASLRVLRPGTGEIVAALDLPARDVSSGLAAIPEAGRAAATAFLAGRKGQPGAWMLYRRLVGAWVADLDLGQTRRLFFHNLSRDAYQKLMTALPATAGIGTVASRQYDARGLTEIAVDSRLDSPALATAVTGILGSAITVDRETADRIDFVAAPPTPTANPGLPGWLWAALGGLACVVVFFIARSLSKKN